jgi:hypothetical protein
MRKKIIAENNILLVAVKGWRGVGARRCDDMMTPNFRSPECSRNSFNLLNKKSYSFHPATEDDRHPHFRKRDPYVLATTTMADGPPFPTTNEAIPSVNVRVQP